MSEESLSAPALEWRVIKQAPAYAVSNYGQIKRIEPDRKGRISGTCLRFTTCSKYGHQVVCLTGPAPDYKRIYRCVHAYVLEAFVGPAPTNKHEGAHWDGDPTNNRIDNLRWATRKQNSADRVRHGTSPVGEKNPRAKLNDSQVLEIRRNNALRPGSRMRQPGTLARLAYEYETSEDVIQQVLYGRTFKHLMGH